MFFVDVIEEKEYTFLQLEQKFQNDDESFNLKQFLKLLKNRGVLKFNKSNNKNISSHFDDGIQNFDYEEDPKGYVFKYVGIIIIKNFVIKSYPKYLIDNPEPKNEFVDIINVLKQYNNSKKYSIGFQEEIDSDFSLLSIILYLFEDYYKNGLYANFQNILEINGTGEIFWDKTINDAYPLIQDNRPYYIELFTKNTIYDHHDYFRLLHEVILTKSSKILLEADLLNLLGFAPINLNNKTLEDFGDIDYIKYRIQRELKVQFNSHKRSLLKAMYLYVSRSDSFLDMEDFFDYFGTTSYKHVWEEICRTVLGNKLDDNLIDLELSQEIDSKYNKNPVLSKIIGKHKWCLNHNEPVYGDPLRPDIITINKKNKESQFIILDAKYYNLHYNKPGLEDVTKQFLYELVFTEFIELHNLTPKNCFLFPIDGENIVHKGYIEFEMFNSLNLQNNKLNLKKIQVILLPAKKMNQCYLKTGKLECNIRNELMNIIKNDDELEFSKKNIE